MGGGAVGPDFWCSCTVGISELNAIDFCILIFPNPAKDYAIVKFDHVPINKVQIFNLPGELAEERKTNGYEIQLDLAGFQPGIYLIRAYTSEGVKTGRLVVQ